MRGAMQPWAADPCGGTRPIFPKSPSIMTLILALIAALFATPLLAQNQSDLEAAKAKYLQAPPASSEGARVSYVHELIQMHDKLMPLQKGPADARFRAVNDEIKKVPAPADSDSAALSKLLAGKWRSPRHDSLYRRNGTWSMLPIEDADTPHGTWEIKGNQFIEDGADVYAIILLDTHDFVYMDKQGDVFYEKRISK